MGSTRELEKAVSVHYVNLHMPKLSSRKFRHKHYVTHSKNMYLSESKE